MYVIRLGQLRLACQVTYAGNTCSSQQVLHSPVEGIAPVAASSFPLHHGSTMPIVADEFWSRQIIKSVNAELRHLGKDDDAEDPSIHV